MASQQDMHVLDFRQNKNALENVVISWRMALSGPHEIMTVRVHPYAMHWLLEMWGSGLLPSTLSCEEHWEGEGENSSVFLVINGIRVDVDPTIPLEKDGTSKALLMALVPASAIVPAWIPVM